MSRTTSLRVQKQASVLLNPLQPGVVYLYPENMRKPKRFLIFEGIDKQHWAVMG